MLFVLIKERKNHIFRGKTLIIKSLTKVYIENIKGTEL